MWFLIIRPRIRGRQLEHRPGTIKPIRLRNANALVDAAEVARTLHQHSSGWMLPTDCVFDSLAVQVELDRITTDHDPGRHAIAIRATAEDGTSGPVTAEFRWIHDPYDSTKQPLSHHAP